jgi:hypothetical protein
VPNFVHARRTWLIAAVVAVLLAVVAVLGWRGYVQMRSLEQSATAQISAGQSQLEAGKGVLVTATKDRDPAALQRAQVHFRQARTSFAAAQSQIGSNGLAGVAGAVPVYTGPRISAARNLADAGVALSDAALEASAIDGQLLVQGNQQLNGAATLLSNLAKAMPAAERVKQDLQKADRALHAVDPSVLPRGQAQQLQKALQDVDGAVASVQAFPGLVNFLFGLVGVGGPKNYLLEQVNPSELRPGGGFIGTYSVIRADQGKLSLVQSGDSYDIAKLRAEGAATPGTSPPPTPLAQGLGLHAWNFYDSNFSPDFPTNAKQAEQMLQGQVPGGIDGVIALDYHAVAAMLGATGPMQVPGSDLTVSESDFIQQITQLDLVQDPSHKSVLSSLAGPLLQKLVSLPAEQLIEFGGQLNQLATQRHLQVYFNDGAEQAEVTQLGQSGALNPTGAGDFMSEVEANVGASKANYFLNRSFHLTLSRSGDTLHHTLQVDLANRTPAQYENWYRAYAALYVPQNATNTSVRGAGVTATAQPLTRAPAGTKVLDGSFQINLGGTQRVVFEYDTPWSQDSSGVHSEYWQKQAGPVGDPVRVVWKVDGHTYQASGDLGQDRVVKLAPDGVRIEAGNAARGGVPSLSF